MKVALGLFGLILSFQSQAINMLGNNKTLCGASDQRMPSAEASVGRLSAFDSVMGCTITMIGKSCAITAGHCRPAMDKAEFNTPGAALLGEPVPSALEDTYEVDKAGTVAIYMGLGFDFGVVRLKPNEITGEYPGAVHGFYPVSFEKPEVGDEIRITGYGHTRGSGFFRENFLNATQQSHTGEITATEFRFPPTAFNPDGTVLSQMLLHNVDTQGGNSGGAIRLVDSDVIIGIHTNGGCGFGDDQNKGVMLSEDPLFQMAINQCLQWEEDNL